MTFLTTIFIFISSFFGIRSHQTPLSVYAPTQEVVVQEQSATTSGIVIKEITTAPVSSLFDNKKKDIAATSSPKSTTTVVIETIKPEATSTPTIEISNIEPTTTPASTVDVFVPYETHCARISEAYLNLAPNAQDGNNCFRAWIPSTESVGSAIVVDVSTTAKDDTTVYWLEEKTDSTDWKQVAPTTNAPNSGSSYIENPMQIVNPNSGSGDVQIRVGMKDGNVEMFSKVFDLGSY
jgi:hypothetical protein